MAKQNTCYHTGFPVARNTVVDQPARQAYQVLRFVFTVAPIIAGIDKFLDLLVDWDRYLAPWIAGQSPIGGHDLMILLELSRSSLA